MILIIYCELLYKDLTERDGLKKKHYCKHFIYIFYNKITLLIRIII